MKKKLSVLACAGALAAAGAVVAAPAASAAPGCSVAQDSYSATVHCTQPNPGTEFQVVSRCPDGLRYSRWAVQGDPVTMQCHGIQVVDVHFR